VATIRIATLNVHGRKGRWSLRRDLLLGQLRATAPDVLALQEAAMWPSQARFLTRALNKTGPGVARYAAVTARKRGWRGLTEGLAVVTRVPIEQTALLDLAGDARVAQRVTLVGPGRRAFDLYNVHLANRSFAGDLRLRQARALLAWMAERPGIPAVVVGDFNAGPDSPVMREFAPTHVSAHAAVHGTEPPWTAPARPPSGPPGRVVDYVLVTAAVKVTDSRLAFHQQHGSDAALFASDHFGLVADLELTTTA